MAGKIPQIFYNSNDARDSFNSLNATETQGEGKKSKKVLTKPKLGQMRDTNQRPDAYKEFSESSNLVGSGLGFQNVTPQTDQSQAFHLNTHQQSQGTDERLYHSKESQAMMQMKAFQDASAGLRDPQTLLLTHQALPSQASNLTQSEESKMMDMTTKNEDARAQRRTTQSRSGLYPTWQPSQIIARNNLEMERSQEIEAQNSQIRSWINNSQNNFTNNLVNVKENPIEMDQELENSNFSRLEQQFTSQNFISYSQNDCFDYSVPRAGDMMIEEDEESRAFPKKLDWSYSNQFSGNSVFSTQCTTSQNIQLAHDLDLYSNSQNTIRSQSIPWSQNSVTTQIEFSQSSQFGTPKKNTQSQHEPLSSQNTQGKPTNDFSNIKRITAKRTDSTNVPESDSPCNELQLECEETSEISKKRNNENPEVTPWSISEQAEELANFKPEFNDPEYVEFLILREKAYTPLQSYLEVKQRYMDRDTRAALLDWIMGVASMLFVKRESVHYAINYIDRYFSKVENVEGHFGLIGITALLIACKIEEIFPPRVAELAQAAKNRYTVETILKQEIKMLKELEWMLAPPTINTWAQWYMNQWDLYLDNNPHLIKNYKTVQFLQTNPESYHLFRELMQLIDCAVLEIRTLCYNSRALVVAFMYLVVGRNLKVFDDKLICTKMVQESLYLTDSSKPLNILFGGFLQSLSLIPSCFNFSLPDLMPSVCYASTFFGLPFDDQLPRIALDERYSSKVLGGHYQEFLAYQTYHPKAKEYTKARNRVYP